MEELRDAITLAILFVSLYFEVFILITYLGKKKELHKHKNIPAVQHPDLPGVTVIVPCFNEENTVARTLDSLLALDYPEEKLRILAIDDGSTDGTPRVLAGYKAKHPQVEMLRKENGGKHTALNLGIQMATTPFVGCLDADSYAKHDSLIRIMKKFEKPGISAVVPSMHVYEPRTLIQKMQKIEYLIGIFLRTILAELNALYVTPGPLSIFRKEVFDKIGYYRKAYNTEDMEMALRMQANGLKIGSAHDAVIYTSSPHSVKKLFKQRVRWTSGFLHNVRDYKYMIFNKRFGHIGSFVLPIMLISFVSLLFIVGSFMYDIIASAHRYYVTYQALGANMFELSWPSFDWFFIRTSPLTFAGIIALAVILASILIGSRLSHGNRAKIIEVVSYMCLYAFIAPFWVIRSLYNFAFGKELVWR